MAGTTSDDAVTSCTPIPEASPMTFLDGHGIESAVAATNRAEVHHYKFGTITVPPVGWSPVTATDAELEAYGYGRRPLPGPELDAWTKMYANFQRPHEPSPCEDANTYASLPYYDSPNWSGPVAQVPAGGQGIVSVDGYTKAPTFGDTCAVSSSSFTAWVGIGNGSPLVQAGWLINKGEANAEGMTSFWEILGPAGTNTSVAAQEPNASLRVPHGDLVFSKVAYVQDATGEYANFTWYDSKNPSNSPAPVKVYSQAGHSISYFFDWFTAEAIDERLKYSQFTQLRQYGTAGWTQSFIAQGLSPSVSVPFDGIPSTEYRMYSLGNDISDMVGHAFNADGSSWNDNWRGCGDTGG